MPSCFASARERCRSPWSNTTAVVLLGSLVCAARIAPAESPPISLTGRYSAYEEEAIQRALDELDARIESQPEGKHIERVDLIVLDPIEERDPAPRALNVLHVSTRRYVIERELLLGVGDRYSKLLADESARKLRALPQLSVVICTAFTGSSPDRVRLVVITKDVWSLILDFDVSVGSTGPGYLLLEPKESNLFGTHQAALLRVKLEPQSYTLGAAYRIPRLDGQWLSAVADMNVIRNRETNAAEGSFGGFQVWQPLRSDRAEWSWFSALTWKRELTRKFGGNGLKVYNASSDPNARVDYLWHTQTALAEAALTRSFGWAIKNDVSVSLLARRESFRLPVSGDLATAAELEFEARELPADSARVGPALEWHTYTSSFLRTFDLQTLGLQEPFRLGHELVLSGGPFWGSLRGSRRYFWSLFAAAQATLPLGDGFARASLAWSADLAPAKTTDANLACRLFIATPRLGFGRLIESVYSVYRYANDSNTKDYLGGDGRLRGYENNYVGARSSLISNLEYRSPALNLAELEFGAVLFLDMAYALQEPTSVTPDPIEASRFGLKQSAGAGVRMVVPQVERTVFRLDFGFPLRPEQDHVRAWSFYFAFGQAFDAESIHGVSPPIKP